YIVTTLVVVAVLSVVLLTQIQVVLGFNSDTFVEGVVTGVDTSGLPVGPNKLNPIQVDSTQLDKDIIELIYEPLIRVRQNGEIEPVLAEDYTQESESRAYRFSLRKNVYWHDGKPLTTQDVYATFYLLKELAADNATNI